MNSIQTKLCAEYHLRFSKTATNPIWYISPEKCHDITLTVETKKMLEKEISDLTKPFSLALNSTLGIAHQVLKTDPIKTLGVAHQVLKTDPIKTLGVAHQVLKTDPIKTLGVAHQVLHPQNVINSLHELTNINPIVILKYSDKYVVKDVNLGEYNYLLEILRKQLNDLAP